jgi:hypothetical protein
MKASELIFRMISLVDKYGDLDTIFDSDSILTEIDSINLLAGPYCRTAVFLICSLETDIADVGSVTPGSAEHRRMTG